MRIHKMLGNIARKRHTGCSPLLAMMRAAQSKEDHNNEAGVAVPSDWMLVFLCCVRAISLTKEP